MIRKIAFCIANYIYKKENTTHAERYGYYYILQLLLLQIFEIIVLLLSSVILGVFKETFIVLWVFIFVRIKMGGIHAKSAKACILMSTLLLCVCGFISKYISLLIPYSYIYIIISTVITILLILILRTDIGIKYFKKLEEQINKIDFLDI